MRPLKFIPPIVIAVFTITRLLMLFAYSEYMSDVTLYHEIATKVLGQGLMSYKETFYGYPPLSLVSLYLPYFVSSEYHIYRFAYQLTNILCDYVTLYFLAKILAEVLGSDEKRRVQTLILYCVLGLFHGHYMYDRVDMVIVMSFTCAIYYSMKNVSSWRAIGFAIFGVLWKIIPVIWLPVVLLLKFSSERWRGLIASSIVSAVSILGFMFAADAWYEGHLFTSLNLHSDRGIQIESFFATPLMILKLLKPSYPVFIELIHGAHHLAGEGIASWYLSASKTYGSLLLAAYFLWVFFLMLKTRPLPARTANARDESAGLASARAIFTLYSVPIILFLISQRVLSTTFTIWLIPITCLWWCMEANDRDRMKILILALLISALTYIGFDIGYYEYRNFSVFYGVVYLVRNILLFAYAVMFFKWCLALFCKNSRQF